MFSKQEARKQIADLVLKSEEFARIPNYNEEQTKKDLILPLFRALNWATEDSTEVTAEENIARKRVDYGFKMDGIPKFYLEAKALPETLEVEHAKQAINYSWLKATTWAVLCNFREIRVYNAEWKSRSTLDKLYFQINCADFEKRFDELWLLSKDSFYTDEIDSAAESWGHDKKKIAVSSVTDQLYDDLVKWRQTLTKAISNSRSNGPKLKDNEILDECVQRILDRLIFIRVAEDKGLEAKSLRAQWRDWKLIRRGKPFYELLVGLFSEFDTHYDSNLFAHHVCDELTIDDLVLNKIVESLYDGPEEYEYDFAAIDADVLGSIYEDYLGFMLKKFRKKTTVVESYTQRKKMGSYYTPTYIVDFIVKSTIGSLTKEEKRDKPPAVLDMACGSGSFLIRAFAFLSTKYKLSGMEAETKLLQDAIHGVDLDPKAVQIAHLNMLIQLLQKRTILPFLNMNIRIGNSLLSDRKIDENAFNWEESFESIMAGGGFDVVIGNPPYLDSEEMTRSQPKLRGYYSDSKNYSAATGNWDIFCLFLERGISLLKPGGYLGMIVPNKLLSADYAGSIRKIISKHKIVTIRDYSRVHVFNAAVYPIVIILKKERAGENVITLEVAHQNEVGAITVEKTNQFAQKDLQGLATWSPLFKKGENELFEKIKKQSATLETLAEVGGAATVSEAYETLDILKELTNHQYYFKFINTGTIDRYASRWGLQNTRAAGSFRNPIVRTEELQKLLPKRAEQAETRKIIIGGMNKRLECYLDKKGEFLAGKSTVIVTRPRIEFEVILGILNSKLTSFCYKNMFQALSLSGGFMRVGPPQIRLLPIKKPTDGQSTRMKELVTQMIGLCNAYGKMNSDSDRGKATLEQIIQVDQKIDSLVYEIYDLNEKETKIVEAAITDYGPRLQK